MLDAIQNKILYYLFKKKTIGFLLFCLSTSVFSQNITTDTLKIQEVQISAQRPLEEIGITKTKIDSSILTATKSESLSELLSENTSVFVKSEGRGALSSVSFRGTSASHTDVLWNGISLKSPMLGEIDFSLIPMFFIDDVSLLHGGASIQSGYGALGGSILIDNKADWNNKLSLHFKQGLGSFSTINDYLQINIGNQKIQSKTRLFYNYSKNDFTFRNKNIADIDSQTGEYIYPIQKNKNADYLQYGLLQEIYIRLGKKRTVSLKYWGQNNDRSLPRLNTYEGDDYSNISKQSELSHRIIGTFEQYGRKSKLQVNSGFVHTDMKYLMQNYISGQTYQTVIYSISQFSSFYNTLKYSYQLFKHTKLTASYNFNYHRVSSLDTVKNEGYEQTRPEHLLFLSWHQNITKRLSSVLMLRQNFIDQQKPYTIPYLAFDYLLSKKHKTYLKFSLSKNYRYPTLNDLYWQPGGNINLKPEEGYSSDISLSSDFNYKSLYLNITSNAFYSKIDNWILWLPSPMGYWTPENVQQVVSKGLELHLKTTTHIKKIDFYFNSNYAYTSSINMDKSFGQDSYKKQLVYVPLHSFNLFFQLKWKRYFINYQHNSYSERYTTTSNNSSQRDWLYPYFMNHLSLGKTFDIKNINISLDFKIYNLFDEEYRSVLSRAMPGRNYLLSIRFKY